MKINYLDEKLVFFLKSILDLDLEKDIVFIKDANFHYIYANKIFCDLFKVNVEDILGQTDKKFIFDNNALTKCYESDKRAYEKDFLIHEEEVFNNLYRVLKIKINLGGEKEGILCFAKLK